MQLIMKHWMTRIRLLHIPLQVQDAGTTKLALQRNAGRNQLDLLSIVNHGECVAFLGFPVDLTGLCLGGKLTGMNSPTKLETRSRHCALQSILQVRFLLPARGVFFFWLI